MTRIGTRSSSSGISKSKFTTTFLFTPESHCTPPNFRIKRPRNRTTPEQLQELENIFNADPSPSVALKTALANKLEMDLKIVNVWFQNKRQTVKKRLLENKTRSSSELDTPPPTREVSLLCARRNIIISDGKGCVAGRKLRNSTPSEEHIDMTQLDDDRDYTEDDAKLPGSTHMKATPDVIMNHVSSSSPASSTMGRNRAAILVRFGGTRNKLEWACANAYQNLSCSSRFRTVAERSLVPDPDAPAAFDSGFETETSDEAHEAITPQDVSIDLPPMAGDVKQLKSATQLHLASSTGVHDIGLGYTQVELDAANILMSMAGIF